MSGRVRATLVAEDFDLDVHPDADPETLALLRRYHGGVRPGMIECREHDDDRDPRLDALRDPATGRVHGLWVYLQWWERDGSWRVCHMPNRAGIELRSHRVAPMTDEHRWQQDYWASAGERAGHQVDLEYRLSSLNRLDVALTGPAGMIGVEVQHSDLSLGMVLRRDQRAAESDVPLVWSVDRERVGWTRRVGHVETQPIERNDRPPGSWTVIGGAREVYGARCHPAEIEKCPTPDRHRRCGGWHPAFRPMTGLSVDRVAELAPAGGLVRLDTGSRQGVILTTPEDVERWRELRADETEAPDARAVRLNRCGWEVKVPEQCREAPVCPRCGPRRKGVTVISHFLCERCQPKTCTGCGTVDHGVTLWPTLGVLACGPCGTTALDQRRQRARFEAERHRQAADKARAALAPVIPAPRASAETPTCRRCPSAIDGPVGALLCRDCASLPPAGDGPGARVWSMTITLDQCAKARDVAHLRLVAKWASAHGAWTPAVRSMFTRRRREIEAVDA